MTFNEREEAREIARMVAEEVSKGSAAGPWQEGEPDEENAYLVEVYWGNGPSYGVATWNQGKWHLSQIPTLENRHVHRYAEINSEHA